MCALPSNGNSAVSGPCGRQRLAYVRARLEQRQRTAAAVEQQQQQQQGGAARRADRAGWPWRPAAGEKKHDQRGRKGVVRKGAGRAATCWGEQGKAKRLWGAAPLRAQCGPSRARTRLGRGWEGGEGGSSLARCHSSKIPTASEFRAVSSFRPGHLVIQARPLQSQLGGGVQARPAGRAPWQPAASLLGGLGAGLGGGRHVSLHLPQGVGGSDGPGRRGDARAVLVAGLRVSPPTHPRMHAGRHGAENKN